jgi:hypothetical protein
VCIVGTHKVHLVAAHALIAHPDVSLDVFHDVADVEAAIGVRQGGGNEETAGGHAVGVGMGRSDTLRLLQTATADFMRPPPSAGFDGLSAAIVSNAALGG